MTQRSQPLLKQYYERDWLTWSPHTWRTLMSNLTDLMTTQEQQMLRQCQRWLRVKACIHLGQLKPTPALWATELIGYHGIFQHVDPDHLGFPNRDPFERVQHPVRHTTLCFLREVIQNAVDAGCRNMHFAELSPTLVYIADDGEGMDYTTLTTEFLGAHQSAKRLLTPTTTNKGSDDRDPKIGGYGRGRFLVIFQFAHWMLCTRNMLVIGGHSRYMLCCQTCFAPVFKANGCDNQCSAAPQQPGVRLLIDLTGSYTSEMIGSALQQYISMATHPVNVHYKSKDPQDTFHLIQSAATASLRKVAVLQIAVAEEDDEELLQRVENSTQPVTLATVHGPIQLSQACAATRHRRSRTTTYVISTHNGLPMFTITQANQRLQGIFLILLSPTFSDYRNFTLTRSALQSPALRQVFQEFYTSQALACVLATDVYEQTTQRYQIQGQPFLQYFGLQHILSTLKVTQPTVAGVTAKPIFHYVIHHHPLVDGEGRSDPPGSTDILQPTAVQMILCQWGLVILRCLHRLQLTKERFAHHKCPKNHPFGHLLTSLVVPSGFEVGLILDQTCHSALEYTDPDSDQPYFLLNPVGFHWDSVAKHDQLAELEALALHEIAHLAEHPHNGRYAMILTALMANQLQYRHETKSVSQKAPATWSDEFICRVCEVAMLGPVMVPTLTLNTL